MLMEIDRTRETGYPRKTCCDAVSRDIYSLSVCVCLQVTERMRVSVGGTQLHP